MNGCVASQTRSACKSGLGLGTVGRRRMRGRMDVLDGGAGRAGDDSYLRHRPDVPQASRSFELQSTVQTEVPGIPVPRHLVFGCLGRIVLFTFTKLFTRATNLSPATSLSPLTVYLPRHQLILFSSQRHPPCLASRSPYPIPRPYHPTCRTAFWTWPCSFRGSRFRTMTGNPCVVSNARHATLRPVIYPACCFGYSH